MSGFLKTLLCFGVFLFSKASFGGFTCDSFLEIDPAWIRLGRVDPFFPRFDVYQDAHPNSRSSFVPIEVFRRASARLLVEHIDQLKSLKGRILSIETFKLPLVTDSKARFQGVLTKVFEGSEPALELTMSSGNFVRFPLSRIASGSVWDPAVDPLVARALRVKSFVLDRLSKDDPTWVDHYRRDILGRGALEGFVKIKVRDGSTIKLDPGDVMIFKRQRWLGEQNFDSSRHMVGRVASFDSFSNILRIQVLVEANGSIAKGYVEEVFKIRLIQRDLFQAYVLYGNPS